MSKFWVAFRGLPLLGVTPDSLAGTMKTYYLTGKLASQQESGHVRKSVLTGVSEWWYPSGQLRLHQEFCQGRSVGELRMYFPAVS